MKRNLLSALFLIIGLSLNAQSASIKGNLNDDKGNAILYANLVLHNTADSKIVKVETTDLEGNFSIKGLSAGNYYLSVSYLGMEDLKVSDISLGELEELDMASLTMNTSSVQLEEAVVTARRAMVEVKPDRTVFNVEGTINSAGDNGLGLLRKAPGVLVDNNENISVLGRSGVLVYVDGKRLPLGGEDLSNYLKNIPAEQIDKIDIITNPGARYEAEGNAGIIDIRLKKNENYGSNGTVSGNVGQGQYFTGNGNLMGNFRNGSLNSFGTVGYNGGERGNEFSFKNYQNGLLLDETMDTRRPFDVFSYRWGTDFFVAKNHTLGFLVSGQKQVSDNFSTDIIDIAHADTPENIDSVLIATNTTDSDNVNNTFNLNYRYLNGDNLINIDADYGRYRNDSSTDQPNNYYDASRTDIISSVNTAYDTPVEIDIYTFKVDFETNLAGGKLGLGSKLSKVATDNTFSFFDVVDDTRIFNDRRSNVFVYDENVYAGYLSYARALSQKTNFSAGLRVETTDATGDLTAFLAELQEPPVALNYTDFFPSIGLTHQINRTNVISANYGRRINRPDYNILNPFKSQASELSFLKGNPFLNPEIVNNFEIGYTLNYRYNFKIAYSKTDNQITRLIGPDEEDPRAGFLSWDNLAEQKVLSMNISAPIGVTEKWNAFFNINGSHIDNQADYGDGGTVDVQAWTYNIFQQHTITLPKGFVGEVSGWFSGPGVWGGVFLYDESYSLNLGLQRRFLDNQMNVKLSAQDITYQSGWSGESFFNGLVSEGKGNWDSRRVNLSISYNFGNNKVKSRKRKTGLEDEGKRVKTEG